MESPPSAASRFASRESRAIDPEHALRTIGTFADLIEEQVMFRVGESELDLVSARTSLESTRSELRAARRREVKESKLQDYLSARGDFVRAAGPSVDAWLEAIRPLFDPPESGLTSPTTAWLLRSLG